MWQQLQQTAKSLSELYLSTSGIEGETPGKVISSHKALLVSLFRRASWTEAQDYAFSC